MMIYSACLMILGEFYLFLAMHLRHVVIYIPILCLSFQTIPIFLAFKFKNI